MSNPDTSSHKSSNEDIDKEVRNLIRKNAGKSKSNSSILDELREKYGKDKNIINAVVDKYNKKMTRVKKLSQKIKERLLAKYPNLSMREYINKINEYKSKYDFDDSEAHAIVSDIFMNKQKEYYDPNDVYSMSNEMTKALGFVPASYNMSGSLNIDKDQIEALQAIIQYDETYSDVHNQVILQSTIYKGVDSAFSTVDIDRQKINIFSFVHPVVAALFMHRFNITDEHMLIASISRIINQKYKGIELQTQPEYELYWDIATDPAETACVTKSKPFDDLLKRCVVQLKLMLSVLNLRQGKFYMDDLNSFIVAIDNCRASVFDAADLAYVKDEGTILRKLLAAFSLRPTIVLTRPVYSISTVYSSIPALAAGHITSLPMVTIRLPYNGAKLTDISGKDADIGSINAALASQKQLYIHHRQIVEKQQELLYSRQLLMFYVHRRYFDLQMSRLATAYTVATLPVTMDSHERLNNKELTVDEYLKLGDGSGFWIRSMVLVQQKDDDLKKAGDKENPIVCCKTHIITYDNTTGKLVKNNTTASNTYSDGTLEYKPLQLPDASVLSSGKIIKPVSWIKTEDALEEASRKGTIFIYQADTKDQEKARGPVTRDSAPGRLNPSRGMNVKIGTGICVRALGPYLRSINVVDAILRPTATLLTGVQYDNIINTGLPDPDDATRARIPIDARKLNMCLSSFGVAIPAGRATPPFAPPVVACAPIVFQALEAQGLIDAVGAHVGGTVLSWRVYQNIITAAIDPTVGARATRALATADVNACIAAIGGLAVPVNPMRNLNPQCRGQFIASLIGNRIIDGANVPIVGKTLSTVQFDRIVAAQGIDRAEALACLGTLNSAAGNPIQLDVEIA